MSSIFTQVRKYCKTKQKETLIKGGLGDLETDIMSDLRT